MGSEGRDRETHGEEPLLLSEVGNRKTNCAGCVSEQFETTNVTGTLHDLGATKESVLFPQHVKAMPVKTHLP